MVLLVVALACGMPATGGAVDPPPNELAGVMRAMIGSTAQLAVRRPDGDRRAGSAIVLGADPATDRVYLITAAHVLTPVVAQEVVVVTQLQRRELAVEVIAVDEALDLALLAVGGLAVGESELTPVALSGQAMLGDDVLVNAFPWGRRATLVRGMVSQIDWQDSAALTEIPLSGPVALIDASVTYGMSGGGVFDRRTGGLVGIVRGYRSARVDLPGSLEQAITVPLAGETTVVSTMRILCFVTRAGYGHLVLGEIGAGELEALTTPQRCAGSG